MLGRLVLGSAQLPAFQNLRPSLPAARWLLSVLAVTPEDWETLAVCMGQGLPVKAIETRAETPLQVAQVAAMGRKLGIRDTYIEVPLDQPELLSAIRAQECYAKARTGGMVQQAFPEPDLLLQFIQGCVQLELPFKLTAGLHHPVRGRYRMTYAPDSEKGVMYGYLNVLLCTALTLLEEVKTAKEALLEEDPHAIHWTPEAVEYAGVKIHTSQLERTRAMLHAFGSCSFTEPHDELLSPAHQRNP